MRAYRGVCAVATNLDDMLTFRVRFRISSRGVVPQSVRIFLPMAPFCETRHTKNESSQIYYHVQTYEYHVEAGVSLQTAQSVSVPMTLLVKVRRSLSIDFPCRTYQHINTNFLTCVDLCRLWAVTPSRRRDDCEECVSPTGLSRHKTLAPLDADARAAGLTPLARSKQR